METVKSFLEELFLYNQLVNSKFIDALKRAKDHAPERSFTLMWHILLVHESWNNRMAAREGLTDFWEEIKIDDLEGINDAVNSESIKIISNVDVHSSFTYKNSKGTEFSSKYIDVLFHLINHSTQHKGQISALFRNSNMEPVVNDYIFYKR